MAISKRGETVDWWDPEGGGRFFPQKYPWIVTVLGFLAFGVLVVREGLSVTPSVLLFATLCALAEFLVIRLPQGILTASFVLVLLTLPTEGPVGSALVIVIGSLVGCGLLRRQLWPGGWSGGPMPIWRSPSPCRSFWLRSMLS